MINLSITWYYRNQSRPSSKCIEEIDRRDTLIDPAAIPERSIAAGQELEAIASLISAASQRTPQIFLAHRSGYTHDEISAAFGIKPRTVEKHIAIAVELLGTQHQ